MQYSPKLKKAMAEIKAIMEREEIAGVVVLHTPGFSEFLNHVNTPYSCAKVLPEGVRIVLKESEVGKERALELANGTFNMVTHLEKGLTMLALCYMECKQILDMVWEEDGGGGGEDEGYFSHDTLMT